MKDVFRMIRILFENGIDRIIEIYDKEFWFFWISFVILSHSMILFFLTLKYADFQFICKIFAAFLLFFNQLKHLRKFNN